MAASDARPVPRKNTAYRLYFAVRKNDGTLITTWAGQDSEVSLDGAAFADCTNEATEIGTTGCGYLDLTAAEMNADCVILKVTVTNTSALPIVLTLFPEESGDYRSDVVMVSGDSTAADNAESFFDGTGYAGTGNTIPAVTTVNGLAANVITDTAIAASAVTEVQTGLSTLDAAGVRNAVGLAAANLDTQIGTLSTASALSTLAGKFSGITLLKNWLGSIAGKVADAGTLAEINATTAGANFTGTTDSLEAIRDRGDAAWVTGGGGGGSGPYSVTITVTDSGTSDPIQGASVRATRTGETVTGTTDVNGEVVFAVTAATFTLTATAAGYSGASQSMVVSGDQAESVELDTTTFTPSNPSQTTGTITVYTAAHVAVSGAVVEVEILKLANGTTGSGIDDPLTSQTTDVNGAAEFTGLPRLATYRVRIDGGAWFRGITLDATETPLMGSLGPAE